MLKQVPIQVWLLIAIAATAYIPARYVFRFRAESPSRRDITKPAENPDWRTPGKLAFNLAALAVLGSLAIFIFTPAAARFAEAPVFWPIVLLAFSAWALSMTVRGFLVGRVQPMVRGYSPTFERRTQPKRYWASMTWNAVLGCVMLAGSVMAIVQAPAQALEDRCYDEKTAHSAKEELSACTQLIGNRSKSHADLSGAMVARGNAYYRLGDYRHARDDYAEAMRLDPKDSASRYNLGLVDEQLGNNERALEDYTAAITVGKDNADAYLNRGNIFLDRSRLDRAISDFNQVLRLRPSDTDALVDRGIAYAWMRDKTRAEQDFAAVRKVDPSNAGVARGEVVLSMNAGNFAMAVEQLTAILQNDHSDVWALGVRAFAYRQLGEADKMQADIDAMKRINAKQAAQ